MIAILRIVFGIGLGYAGIYAALFIIRRRRQDLRRALGGFAVTAVIALIFFAGLVIERLMSGG